jgi:hypothetical protein
MFWRSLSPFLELLRLAWVSERKPRHYNHDISPHETGNISNKKVRQLWETALMHHNRHQWQKLKDCCEN